MFATAFRSLPRSVKPAPNVGITAGQQAVLLTGSVGAWAAVLIGAPWWAPKAGDRATRFFERMERLPKMRRPLGIRIPVPRVGSVQL